jgi:hypothetical protein
VTVYVSEVLGKCTFYMRMDFLRSTTGVNTWMAALYSEYKGLNMQCRFRTSRDIAPLKAPFSSSPYDA